MLSGCRNLAIQPMMLVALRGSASTAGRPSSFAGDGTRDEVLALTVHQSEDAVLGARHFQRHLQNRFQRFFRATP